MNDEYLRVIPTSAKLRPNLITNALPSLYKLSVNESAGYLARLNLFQSEQPVTFEFVVISEAEGEPVEFYYGADDRLDVLRQRLTSI